MPVRTAQPGLDMRPHLHVTYSAKRPDGGRVCPRVPIGASLAQNAQ